MSSPFGLTCNSFTSVVLRVGVTAFYLRGRQRHHDVRSQLKGIGAAILSPGGAFVMAFLLHILMPAPRLFAEEGQKVKKAGETARKAAGTNLLVRSEATPAPVQPAVTETDSQARKQTEDTKKESINAIEAGPPLDPSVQPLVSAVSTVDVTIKTTKDINFHTFDRGGYAAIATARGPMLVTRGGDCSGKLTGPGEATFHGIFGEMTASGAAKSLAIGKPIADLREADFIQIEFAAMEANPVVVRGKVIFTLNNFRQLHFEIPPQKGVGKKIYVRDLSSGMRALSPAPRP